ncbi:hypothetical protein MF672_050275 [Actinomadura sp. ATCC 31491]|uniref:Uncharacterized protein n=1 Tax=Actinomadura luzonensis TaxID=2805427 RepID=A0ABT0GBF4_9ACTN|nr:hypothetical protein [Actinomadura luzonensis]MCK2221945.1 hypothetical protein [Actinomadura luzonensis]
MRGRGKPVRRGTVRSSGNLLLTDLAATLLTERGGPAVYVEAYGMPGRETYGLRKRTKQAHYQQTGILVVEWDVTGPLRA